MINEDSIKFACQTLAEHINNKANGIQPEASQQGLPAHVLQAFFTVFSLLIRVIFNALPKLQSIDHEADQAVNDDFYPEQSEV